MDVTQVYNVMETRTSNRSRSYIDGSIGATLIDDLDFIGYGRTLSTYANIIDSTSAEIISATESVKPTLSRIKDKYVFDKMIVSVMDDVYEDASIGLDDDGMWSIAMSVIQELRQAKEVNR